MRKTQKHLLDFEKVFSYFYEHIECGKTLSKVALDRIDFKKGYFYTILPNDAFIERIYKLELGGIIPSVPFGSEKVYTESLPEGFFPTQIITTDREVCELIYYFIQKNKENFSITENYMSELGDPDLDYMESRLLFHENEVYYLNNENNSLEGIYETFRNCSQVWHSLTILSHLNYFLKSPVSKENLEEICDNAQFVIISAYDGEGSIIWEKNQ